MEKPSLFILVDCPSTAGLKHPLLKLGKLLRLLFIGGFSQALGGFANGLLCKGPVSVGGVGCRTFAQPRA